MCLTSQYGDVEMPVYLNGICWIHTGISNGRLFAVSFMIILQKHPPLAPGTRARSKMDETAAPLVGAPAPRCHRLAWSAAPRIPRARVFSPPTCRQGSNCWKERRPDGGAVHRGSARKHPPALCPVASSPPHQFSGCESVATFLTASISSGASEFDWGEDSGAEDHSGNWYLLFLWTILKHLFGWYI